MKEIRDIFRGHLQWIFADDLVALETLGTEQGKPRETAKVILFPKRRTT